MDREATSNCVSKLRLSSDSVWKWRALSFADVEWAAANTSIQREMGFSNEQMGYIFAGFSVGYFWFQVPGAWFGNRAGARLAFPTFAIIWSLATLWTGVALTQLSMWWSRLLFGIAQAGLFPSSAKVVNDSMPESRRALSGAIVSGGMSTGAVLASGLTAVLLPIFGWRVVLALYSALGILWAVPFYLFFQNRPSQHPRVNAAERELIASSVASNPRLPAPMPEQRRAAVILSALKNRSVPQLCLLQNRRITENLCCSACT